MMHGVAKVMNTHVVQAFRPASPADLIVRPVFTADLKVRTTFTADLKVRTPLGAEPQWHS